jgi:hypothetical protein
MKKPRKPSKAEIKRAADRAEGVIGDDGGMAELDEMPDGDTLTRMVKMGRPPAYKPEFPEQATKLCKLGAVDVEIASFFKVNISTISEWKTEHPEFGEALKVGKSVADDRVERSLYTRAIGYTYESVKIFLPKGSTRVEDAVIVPYLEHVPPDTTACIFWLKNRRKDQWRDVHRHEIGRAGEFDKLSDAELVTELAKTAQLLLTDQTDKGGDE